MGVKEGSWERLEGEKQRQRDLILLQLKPYQKKAILKMEQPKETSIQLWLTSAGTVRSMVIPVSNTVVCTFCYQKEAFYDLYLHILKAQETPCTMEYSSESLVTYLTFLRNRKLITRRCGITQPLRPLIHSYQYIIFVFALAKPRANLSFSHQHATPSLQRHTQSTIALNCLPRLKTDRHKRGPISEIAVCRPLIKIHCHPFNN